MHLPAALAVPFPLDSTIALIMRIKAIMRDPIATDPA
jgi:hypothetical protein